MPQSRSSLLPGSPRGPTPSNPSPAQQYARVHAVVPMPVCYLVGLAALQRLLSQVVLALLHSQLGASQPVVLLM